MPELNLGLLQADLTQLLLQTGWVARVVLLILLGFSVFSWAVIYRKYIIFRRARGQTARFLEVFRTAQSFPEARPLVATFPATPLASVYAAGMQELNSLRTSNNPQGKGLKSTDAINVAMHLASATEVSQLEERMSFLATTGAVTPFIGLFGTVWGIMGAFMGLGQAGATTLSAVAPGIAEALIATAAGLFAAIPAVIAYNYFLHQVREFATRMNNFSLEFLTRAEKIYS